ncbi:pyruvate-formate lyase-activating enzyme [Paenibacillus macerans]|uniref:Pyruvate-formate lyase-activating enzyme n=1 Tax=Paenibacillus macerans TaxID=44252 RepID=A0A6N8EYI9_PAEMA|nr:pyruvate-formate lyase-activating enzyme [Paenibacillus macerans]MBS5910268.1 pyruvate-formate lyase-activating enzyme [Paenibacillus macerans]MDU5945950.1 pyruvate-formate lyase-activating enzyme [Paenibacillus macerans]MEC0329337.1 pyruvate-formate lyase-activating enzyme [Paenibacillus macerans]MUG24919.1 pyruvate-formate lyase-activating enzyme [Paenibacillus macerans]
MSELIPFIELAKFLSRYPKQPVEHFAGKYKHIRFNWIAYANGDIDSSTLICALDGVHMEERRVFIAQVIYRIIEGENALERLLRAAFSCD